MKPRVQLVQVNYAYGRNVFLPYSVGLIQAYAISQPDIAGHYEFLEPLYLRRPVDEVVETMLEPAVLGLSCYIWNWEYCKALGEVVKEKWPHCLVVLGGTQVPHNHKGFALAHPWADVLVYYEGELVFAEILREWMKPEPDLSKVNGIIICRYNHEIATSAAGRINELDTIPSPYLAGVFDSIMQRDDLSFQATQETHRGCPYSCTFCDWGSATMNKVRKFGDERLRDEFEWFGENGIDLTYNADANYGLFERDIALTQTLVDTKRKFGLPTKFRAAYAKNSNDRVFEIARILNDEGMCKGVTLSFQSMDTHTLEVIKRKNMDVNDFRAIITRYRQANIPTYTELIVGLPGESYDTFSDGIEKLLCAGAHDSLNVYPAMLLENSEMSKPGYMESHGIQGVWTPLLLSHGTKDAHDIQEWYQLVISTNTMPKHDWIRTMRFAYVVQAFHCLNITQSVAVAWRDMNGMPYRTFYEKLIEYFYARPDTNIGSELHTITKLLTEVADGKGSLDLEDRRFGDVMWPVEEIIFLRLVHNSYDLFLEIRAFAMTIGIPADLVFYQMLSTLSLKPLGSSFQCNRDWHTYVTNLLLNSPSVLENTPVTLAVDHTEYSDWPTFAREVVWYGRKGGCMRRKLTKETL